jgi:hypothetical protein
LLLQRYDEGLLTDPQQQSGGTLPSMAEAQASLARLTADLISWGDATELFARDRGEQGLAALALCWWPNLRQIKKKP